MGSTLLLEDRGLSGHNHGTRLSSLTYNADRAAVVTAGSISARFELARTGYFYPGFLQRLVLRLGSTTAWSSRRLREAIDWYRQRKRTAINQSGTSVGKSGGDYILKRQIDVEDERVIVSDTIARSGLSIRPLLGGPFVALGANTELTAMTPLTIRKVVVLASGQVSVEQS